MLRRRVHVLRLGSSGPGGDQKSLRLCPQAFARVRKAFTKRSQSFRKAFTKRSRVSRIPRSREAQNCRHFRTCDWFSYFKSVNSHGVLVVKRRTVVTFGLAPGSRVSKCQQSRGSGGSWSQNAELSSLWDLRLVLASQNCQQSQGSGGPVAKRRTVVAFGASSREKRRGEDRKREEREREGRPMHPR